MLQIKEINKEYVTGQLHQKALDNVSLNLRDNEFVAILGPSGSGKTTLLNVIGGLDKYDSGDLIINGISTKKYKDKDWDSYRNHTIGFVFQSYNLIPHQSILANVELALTISGISKKERRKRAKECLEKVGLKDQLHKKPNQMSGGQMQRVAIARALVNDPQILLADEPTGALDTQTSIQVMELLKEVAKERLVVMVTHNPELANEYANRIVRLKDGVITDDSNSFEIDTQEETIHKKLGKASMKFTTALGLSFNNLRTKKGRTLLTSFAGSIGIIGIALILAMSNGVNTYITNIQKSTMESYPITIESQTYDFSSIISIDSIEQTQPEHDMDGVYTDISSVEASTDLSSAIVKNNLTPFKEYLEDKNSEINKYIGAGGVDYTYDTSFSIYTHDENGVLVNVSGEQIDERIKDTSSSMFSSVSNNESYYFGDSFVQLPPGNNQEVISSNIKESYDLLYGEWPSSKEELVLILDDNNEIDLNILRDLGLFSTKEYDSIIDKIEDGQNAKLEKNKWDYEQVCNQNFIMLAACDNYVKQQDNTWKNVADDRQLLEKRLVDGLDLRISGIIKPKDEENLKFTINGNIAYTSLLTSYLISYTNESEIVQQQQDNKDINVINGLNFSAKDDSTKIKDMKNYLEGLNTSEKAAFFQDIMESMMSGDMSIDILSSLSSIDMYSDILSGDISDLSEESMVKMLDELVKSKNCEKILINLYDKYISNGSYEDNISMLGVISEDSPSTIYIYADTFSDKEEIENCIKKYNENASEENQINYTDYIGKMIESVTKIINVISYILIGFVAVSLVVSSIMIGIITYISVLERTKEIGILRAIGASKKNISQVFNAETFIIGLCSGLLGIGVASLMLIPGNAIIHMVAQTDEVSAKLPFIPAIILIAISIVLTMLGGIIPAKKASKKDPVTALRSE